MEILKIFTKRSFTGISLVKIKDVKEKKIALRHVDNLMPGEVTLNSE